MQQREREREEDVLLTLKMQRLVVRVTWQGTIPTLGTENHQYPAKEWGPGSTPTGICGLERGI